MKLASSFSGSVHYRITSVSFTFQNVSSFLPWLLLVCLLHAGKYFVFHSPAVPAPVTYTNVRVCVCGQRIGLRILFEWT